MKKKVVVFGFYGKQNIGDDLFIEAFQHLFPQLDFTFTDYLNDSHINSADALFLGGGSFLAEDPKFPSSTLQAITNKNLPIFYIGVGSETDIHPTHIALLQQAKLIASRTPQYLDKLLALNSQVIAIPDLVYSLQAKIPHTYKSQGSILVIPNIAVVPQQSSPHWKHAAWHYFKSEFCQFLDTLAPNYHIEFFPFCRAPALNDTWSAFELISHMDHRGSHFDTTWQYPQHLPLLTSVVAKMRSFPFIITQRYHGIALSEMLQIPHMVIQHHDKLKQASSLGVPASYYHSNKQSYLDAFQQLQNIQPSLNSLPLSTDYKALIIGVQEILNT